MQGMNVKIGAEISDLIKGVDLADHKLADFGKTASKVQTPLNSVTKGSNQAGTALSNLSRVAQDAPYGFIGVANNINPLLESFQRLKTESGSTGNALKALGSSLMGGGGLGLAVGIASSLLVVFGDKLFGSKKATDEAASNLAYLQRETNAYSETLKKATQAAGENLAQVTKLVAAAQLETTSIKQRKEVIKQLQDISEDYFSGLRIEGGIVVGLAKAYSNYAQNIYKVAQAKAASEEVGRLSAELASITGQINELGKGFQLSNKNGLVGGFDAAKKKAEELQALVDKGNVRTFAETARLVELTGKSEREINNTIGKREQLITKQLQLTARIQGLAKDAVKGDLNSIVNFPEFKDPKPKKIKIPIEPSYILNDSKYFTTFLGPDLINRLKQEGLSPKIPVEFEVKGVDPTLLIPGLTALEKQINDFNTEMAKNIGQTINNAFSSIGDGIGRALSEGGNFGQKVFGSLFQTIAAGMKQLGESMVALGTAKIALEKFKFAPGAGTIAAGIGIIALSSILKNAIPQFAGGVTGFGGGMALVGERGPELVRLPQGSDVIPNHRLNSITGRGPEIIIPSIKLQGPDLIIAFERAQRQAGRRG